MAVDVGVDVSRLESRLALYVSRQPDILRLFQMVGGQAVVDEMQAKAPVKTGLLRSSITKFDMPDGFFVQPTVSYAEFVEKGTGPHLIFPSSAKVLRFMTEEGATIFARYVKHPGFAGRFFVRRTAEIMRDRLAQILSDILESVYGS